MKAADLKKFQKILLDMKKELLQELKDLEKRIDENPIDASTEVNPYPIHPSDLGTDEEIRESSAEIYSKLSEKLRDIEYALQKINDKSYGKCENCGKDIGLPRLKALPFTKYCIKCAEMIEG